MRQTIAFNFVLQIYSLLYYCSTRLVGTTGQRTTYACLDCQSSALRSQKMHVIWVSRYVARKYWLRTLLLRLQLETGLPFYVVIRAIRRSRAKVVPSFLSYFQTLSIGPAPGIEPATSRSAVKRSNDCANPAAHFELRKLFWFYVTSRITHYQISFLAEKELLSYTFLWKTVTFNIPTYQNKSPTQPVLFCFSWRVTF